MKNEKNDLPGADKEIPAKMPPDNERPFDETDPDDYSEECFCGGLYHALVCITCRHWDGYTCGRQNAACHYEPTPNH